MWGHEHRNCCSKNYGQVTTRVKRPKWKDVFFFPCFCFLDCTENTPNCDHKTKIHAEAWILCTVTPLELTIVLFLFSSQTGPDYGQGMNPISRLAQIQQAKKEKEPEYLLLSERGMPRRREFIMQVNNGFVTYSLRFLTIVTFRITGVLLTQASL